MQATNTPPRSGRNESAADAVAFHDQIAARWEGKYRKSSFATRNHTLARCLDELSLHGKYWLDAGCGSGTQARLLAQRGAIVQGVDGSMAMIQQARTEAARHGSSHENLTFTWVKSIETLPFTGASFDGVLCSSVLEYVADPNKCVAEVARILRPGGVYIVSVPNRASVVRQTLHVSYRLTSVLGKPWPRWLEFSRQEFLTHEFAAILLRHQFTVEAHYSFGGPLPGWLACQPWGGSLMMFVATKGTP